MSKRGCILVIDDEAHIVAVLSLKLRNAGYEVLTAADGEEGLAIVQERIKKTQQGGAGGGANGDGAGEGAGGARSVMDAGGSARGAMGAGGAGGVGGGGVGGIDLIITDFHMPYMTGVELCKALAADGSTAAIPVLLLTARGYALDPEDLRIGAAGGPAMIRDVLSKPFSPRAIVDKIETLLGGVAGESSSSSASGAASGEGAGPKREAA